MHSTWLTILLLAIVMAASVDIMRRAFRHIVLIARQKENHALQRRLRRPLQPWVTVIVYGNATEQNRLATLHSLQRVHYYAFDIVEMGPRAKQFYTAYRKSSRGKLVVCVKAGSIVDKSFLKRAVIEQKDRRAWKVSVGSSRTSEEGLLGVIHTLRDILWPHPVMADAYRAAELRQRQIPTSRFNAPLLTAAACALVIVAVIAAVMYESIVVLWYIWLIFTMYIVALIALRFELKPGERRMLLSTTPSALFLLPTSSIIEAFTQLHTRK